MNYYEVQFLTEYSSETFNYDNAWAATKKYDAVCKELKDVPHIIVLAFNAPECYFVSKEHTQGI